MVWIKDVLNEDLPDAEHLRAEGIRPSLSNKPWALPYHEIKEFTLYQPTHDHLNFMLAHEGEDDIVRTGSQDSTCHEINYLSDTLTTEGDSVASWRVQVTQGARIAFTEHPEIRERSECGPPGPTNFDKTVDHYFSFLHNGAEHCIALGECKTYGIIDAKA
ncbi:hypothetical protein EJ08DRAFT_656352 [Tothia fuscella]|uniref:Uncharacterized protein n=1 Tax=Tothia fuscella TaxID=1048955 RepID=A0A9P4NZF6_9PEZI|nr:hypothetical protein EJ08DRAFT_656352 [Tothia fuscella]